METQIATLTFDETSYNLDMTSEIDLHTANEKLKNMSPTERVDWAIDSFGSDLYAMTSAGIDSALMIDLISHADTPIPVIFINTGFLPKDTLSFKDELVKKYNVQILEFGPTKNQIQDVVELDLLNGDDHEYSKITKLNPMSDAIESLGVKALLSGIHSDQTENRASLKFIGLGNDGEYRINPFLDWSSDQVKNYFDDHNLPRHPLYYQGYESVGDIHTTKPGKGREGRAIMECGLHVANGKVIRNK